MTGHAPDSTIIIVPTLWRSTHIAPFLHALHNNVFNIPYEVLFLAQDGDDPTLDELERCGADYQVFPTVQGKPMSMVAKFNAAAKQVTHPFIFGASDDIRFTRGCLERCHHALLDPTKHIACVSDGIRVHNHGGELTGHCLVRTSYIREQSGVLDEPNQVMFSGYHHYYSDLEFMSVGRLRGCYVSVFDARVEHAHPNDKSAPVDRVHAMDRAYRTVDKLTFYRRAHMWQNDDSLKELV